jgi:chemotaxis protein CheD
MLAGLQADRLPSTLPGFESIHRYWNAQHNGIIAKIKPGEYYITRTGDCISTVLGSCVAACIRDPENGIGGMNHFMLPSGGDGKQDIVNDALRYGNYAMEHLLNDIVKYGGKRKNLEIKLFGGANIAGMGQNIGLRNVDFICKYVASEGLQIKSKDLGGDYPRKILYFPASGKLMMKKLENSSTQPVIEQERDIIRKINTRPIRGEVELFT